MQPIPNNECGNLELSALAFATLLRIDHEPWAEPVEGAPYLEGIPQMSDELARLAAHCRLTPAEEQTIGAEVERICQLIRTARMQWETNRADAVLCL